MLTGSSENDQEEEVSHPSQADIDNSSNVGKSRPSPLRVKRRRKKLISPSLILKVFPILSAASLCELSELEHPTPSEVLKLTGATAEQIGEFFEQFVQSSLPGTRCTACSSQQTAV